MHNYYTETQRRIKKIWSVKKKVVLLQPLFEKKNGVLAHSNEPLFYFITPL